MPLSPIAYLVSQYPAVSHTFILREIRRLRTLGLPIASASINPPDREISKLDADEQEEAGNTFYVKEQGASGAMRAWLKLMAGSPLSLIKGIACACKLAGWDPRRLFKYAGYLAEAAILGEWMRAQEITHVHVHFANPASAVALLASELYPVSFSLTVHGPDEFYDASLNNLKEKFQKAEFIICISFYAQSQVMKYSALSEWHKFHVVRLGVDTDIFAPRFEPVRDHPCQILCVGRLVPGKGQQILIAAFDKLVQRGKNIHLRFIGGGPDRYELEEEVRMRNLQDRVHFSGPMNPRQVLEAYYYADIVALASFAEGLPVVLMEAMSLEIPCVATCINGIPELIRHNVEGLLVAPSHIDQLAHTLELLVEDSSLRQRLGRAARERILETYNLDENIAILYRYFKDMLVQ